MGKLRSTVWRFCVTSRRYQKHSLSLSALDEVADHYWSGRTVEEIGLTFMNEPWQEPPVIEALYQGTLEPVWGHEQSGWLPGFR